MPELPFVIDRRGSFPGQPVTHALIIGIGRYARMTKLPAGAHTSVQIARWLVAQDAAGLLPAPLETLTLVMSPMLAQKSALNALVGEDTWADATDANITAAFERWRALMRASEAQITAPSDAGGGLGFYYYGGHGADFHHFDPIGFAADTDLTAKPYAGAFDHKEQREQTVLTPAGETHPTHPMRCLFLYDCCRRRGLGRDIETYIPFKYDPILEISGTRPFLAINATSVTAEAWEPDVPLALPPIFPLPLSYFGHAWLNAAEWRGDVSQNPSFAYERSTSNLMDDLRRAMLELARSDGVTLRPPEQSSAATPFPILYGNDLPEVSVELACDPAADHSVTAIDFLRKEGGAYNQIRALAAPWPQHPHLSPCPPAVIKLIASIGGTTTAEREARLSPSLGPWRWIVRNGAIDVFDPSS